MQEVAAYSTLAMTLSLVVTRPRLRPGVRLSPAMSAFAGVLLMALFGVVTLGGIRAAALDLWRPFVAIGSIMVMTDVALRVGLLDWWAGFVEAGARTAAHLYLRVFVLGVVAATVLNNDAAILLLTPLVVRTVRRRYPSRPALVLPFAFAVFMAAGVAPFVVSNPMNMVVAELAGIGFNEYAVRMVPVALVGWFAAFLMLRWLFRSELAAAGAAAPGERAPRTGPSRPQVAMMALLGLVLGGYSLIAYAGGPVWAVAAVGAAIALTIGRVGAGAAPVQVVREGISWETLAFLLAVLVLATGLLNVGFVGHLAAHYGGADVGSIGVTSALGSAVLNNHPMAYLNMMALESAGHGHDGVLAALIGGDLGPRLLPMGSLAGLLWLEMLRRDGVAVPLRRFVTVGGLVTLVALPLSLLALAHL